jgi:hypothetical protein
MLISLNVIAAERQSEDLRRRLAFAQEALKAGEAARLEAVRAMEDMVGHHWHLHHSGAAFAHFFESTLTLLTLS